MGFYFLALSDGQSSPARPLSLSARSLQGAEVFQSDEGHRFYIQGSAGQVTLGGRQRRASSSALTRSGHFAEVVSFRGSIGRTSSDGSLVRAPLYTKKQLENLSQIGNANVIRAVTELTPCCLIRRCCFSSLHRSPRACGSPAPP